MSQLTFQLSCPDTGSGPSTSQTSSVAPIARLRLRVADGVAEGVPLGEYVADGVLEGVALGEGVAEGVRLGVRLGVLDGV